MTQLTRILSDPSSVNRLIYLLPHVTVICPVEYPRNFLAQSKKEYRRWQGYLRLFWGSARKFNVRQMRADEKKLVYSGQLILKGNIYHDTWEIAVSKACGLVESLTN
jgi:hypothetical protein